MKNKMIIPSLNEITITDPLIGHYVETVEKKLIGYQWAIMNDRVEGAEKSYVVENFRKAAGEAEGQHKGAIFCDTDAYKWIETVAFCLSSGRAKEYEKTTDELIDLIGRAQQEDGYLNTYFILSHPDEKWKNLAEGHELYGAGHLMEAAAAYYNATGKKDILNIACRFADLIVKVFTEDNIKGCPGHQEVEIGLIKLYRVTGKKDYLSLAQHFIEIRGEKPNYLIEEMKRSRRIFPEFADYDEKYAQSHEKPVNQTTAEGHAVRAMYMYSAMADVALELNDKELKKACEIIWNNVVNKRMYITGGVGSSGHLERFTTDYDLPNDRTYCESCASVGLMMFGQRMAMLSGNASFYEIVEKALCNTVLSGVSSGGDKYFYVNPLEVWPDNCLEGTSMKHVKPVRQPWFACACCPPNIARTLASIGQYIYSKDDKAVYINQFISSEIRTETERGKIAIKLKADLLNSNTVKIVINNSAGINSEMVKVRIPSYFSDPVFTIDGATITPAVENGYAVITISKCGDQELVIKGNIKPRFMSANERVRTDTGKIALTYGPYVYCLEQVDNGELLPNVFVDAAEKITLGEPISELPGGLPVLKFKAKRLRNRISKLYDAPRYEFEESEMKAIAYCQWCNRTPGEMLVWMNAFLG